MKNKIWNIVYVAALMGTSILGGCGDKEQVEQPVVAEEDGKDGDDTGKATETPVEEPQEPTAGTISIKVMAANETGAVSGAEVKLSGEAGELSSTTDDAGNAVFNDVAFGDYTIKCDADGYNGSEMSINLSETEKKPVVAMVPEATGDDAYVLLTWNGEHDIDLCAFNTDMKEYINIGHPIDSEGNVFLYADHDADLPYEVIYIHNASAEVAKTIYVTEAKNAREGAPSQMEADGVSVRVYNSTGLIYETTAKTDETAALWCPCYTYAGEVYDQQDYISNTANDQYTWISFEEKDAYTADASGATVSEAEWKAVYLEYVKNVTKKHFEENSEQCEGFGYNDIFYFYLIYIDNDNIPELLVGAGSEALVSYHNGKLQGDLEASMNSYTGLYSGVTSYIEGEGSFIWRNCGHSGYNESVCYLDNSGFSYGIGGDAFYPDYLEGDYTNAEYYVEDKKCIDEADYQKEMGYDYAKATEGEGKRGMYFRYDDLIEYLSPTAAKQENGSNVATAPVEDWKKAYIEIIKKHIYYNGNTFYPEAALIYLDGDSIPELVVDGVDAEGDLSALYTYSNGQIVTIFEQDNEDGDVITDGWYIPKAGLLMSSITEVIGEGPEDIGHWDIIKWDGKKSDTLWSGSKDADYGFEDDGKYWDKYYYFVNDQAVSEKEYNSSLAAIGWDENKAISIEDDMKSYENIVDILSGGSSF